jgi:hypothetical protein
MVTKSNTKDSMTHDRIRQAGLAYITMAILGMAGACESEDTLEGGAGGPATETYQSSECGTCALDACASEVTACNGDPGCAAYLSCVRACDVGIAAGIDPTCESACPVADSSTTSDLKAALTLCRLDGAGKACAACEISTAQQCAPSVETPPCWICEDEQCCETQAACLDDPDCKALNECWKACPEGDAVCEDQCALNHPLGFANFGPRFACVVSECGSECGSEPCADCIYQSCGNSMATCLSNQRCWLLQRCVGQCAGSEDGTCNQACLDEYADVNDEFAVYGLCVLDHCQNECEAGG